MADVNANIGVNIDTSLALAQLKSLQRQISQFHTSIARSSETSAIAQKSLQKNFLNSVNAIGSFSAELRTVKTSTESFTSSLEGNKFSMREYFRYAGGATKTFGRLFRSEFDTIEKVATERVKRLQTQYIKMGRDVNGSMQAISIMPTSLNMQDYGTKTAMAAQKQALFNQLMKQGSTNLLNFGKNTQWAGRQLMVGFTIPLAMVGSAATKTFMDMEAQALKFRKVYGDLFTPQEETEQALENITELGRQFTKYGVAVSTTVGLAAEAAAAGFAGLDLQRQTTEATRLSILGQIDTQKALETTISLQNAFGMSSANLADSINFLNAVENQTVVSLDDITTAIPKVAPVVQQLGGDIKDLTFFITAMKEGGINATQGANALKSGLASLINPTSRASDMLKSFGINASEIVTKNRGDLKATVIEFAEALNALDPLNRAQAIEQMFGKFQFARISTLFSNVAKDGNQASRVLDLANSSVEELSALSEQELGMTADSAMNKFKKTVEDLKAALIPVGEAFLEAVTPIVKFVGNILEKFSNLSDGTKKTITLMATVIGAIGPIALMTFGLLANGIANIIKLFLTLRNGYLRLTGQSQILGEQTQYLTMEQIDAAAASHSLNQAHATLTQQFTAESAAVNQLIAAYQGATRAGAAFAAANPGSMLPRRTGYANGVVSVPGSGNKDTVPAMLTPGEAVVPAAMAKKYAPLIQAMIAGNILGFKDGTGNVPFANSPKFQPKIDLNSGRSFRASGVTPFRPLPGGDVAQYSTSSQPRSSSRTQSLNPYVSGHVAGFEPTQLPQTVKNLQNVMESLTTSTNKQEVAMRTLLEDVLTSSIGIQNFGEVVDGVAIAQAKVIKVLGIAEKNAAMVSGGVGARITGNARNEAFRQGRISEPITFRQASEGVATVRPIVESGQLASGKAIMPKYLAELQNLITTTDSLSTEQQQAQFGLSNMRKIIADQIVAANKNITQENLGIQVDAKMDDLTKDLISTGSARFNSETGLIESMNDYKAELVFAAKQLKTASLNNLGAATTSIPGINQATRVAMRSTPSDINVELNRRDPSAKLVMAGKRTDAALKTALEGSIPGLQNAGEEMGDAITDGVAIGAETKSPSKKTIKVGEDISKGLEIGLESRKDEVAAAGADLGKTATQSISKGAKTSGPITTGQPFNIQKTQGGVTVGQVAAGAPIGPDIKQKAIENARITQTATDRLRGLDRNIMGASFAISSLAGLASFSGGKLGDMAGTISKVTGAMFALQAITGLLTQTNALSLIQKRAELSGMIVGNAATKKMRLNTTLFSGGIKKLLPNLFNFGKMIVRFLGPIGIAIGVVTAGVSIIRMVNAARERERVAIEGLGDAALLSADKLKTLGEFFGVSVSKSPLEQAKPLSIVSSEERTKVDQLRSSESFQKDFAKDIKSLEDATTKQAELIFKTISVQLKGKGFQQEQIQTIITALKDEAGKTDVKLDFKTLDLSTDAGVATITKDVDRLLNSYSEAFKEGYSSKVNSSIAYATGETVSWTTETISKGLKKNISTASKSISGLMIGISGQFANGTINAEKFNQSFDGISNSIASMPQADSLLLMNNILKNLPSELAQSAVGIKNVSDQLLVAKAAALGVATITPAMIAGLKAASQLGADPRAGLAAGRIRARITKDMKAIQAIITQVVEDSNAKFKDLGEGSGEKSPFQLAVEQLKQQRKEMLNTVKAYGNLTKAGVAAGKAFEIAKDPILAAAIATTKVGTEKWKQLIKLIKETDAALLKSKLTELRADTGYTKQFTAIVPVLKELGLDASEIESIFSDPSFAQQFIKNVKNGKIESEDLNKIITKTMKNRNAKLTFETSLKSEEELFDDAMIKANEMFDKVQAGIELQYREQVEIGETAVEKAQTSVDDIQTEIDNIQTTISAKQREVEINITREIEKFQSTVEDLQKNIKENFDAPLEKLSDEGDILSNTLSLIDRQESAINKKYDEQAAALTKISEINSEIAGQQKQQLGLADALSRGDIAAAAAAAQEMRATAAAAAQGRQSGVIEAARTADLSAVTVNGMTRIQIEERQFQISQQSFALQQQRKVVEQDIANIEANQIAPLTAQRIAAEREIRNLEDSIYNIQIAKLVPAQQILKDAEATLENTQKKLKADLDIINQDRRAYEAKKIAMDLATIDQEEYEAVLIGTEKVAKGVLDNILALDRTVTTKHIIQTVHTSSGTPFGQAGSSGTTKKMYGGKIIPMNYGGMVPKYMAEGGAVGSDTVPAMLTPGEFVMNKAASKRFGPMLESMNNSKYPSMIKDLTPTTYTNVNLSKVTPIINNVSTSVSDNSSTMYNYSVGINVNESNASSSDIARAVIGQIKYIDSQRIRGQR